MTKPVIAIELKDLPHVPVSSLEPLQGKLKDLAQREYNKLKRSITENGLIVPFFVWLEEGKLLDGHQRQRIFQREGWEMDVPVVYISAADEQDAKRKLLVISSQYGKITQEGWDEFTFDLPDDWLMETTHFDALPFVFEGWADIGAPASLDDLANEYGDPEERDFWPWVKVQVSPETMEKYEAVMTAMPGRDDAEKFDALVSGTELP